MHRRFLFPLAAGIVGLLAFSPVLAAQPSPAADSSPAKATTTTAPADDSSGQADSGSADPGDSGSADSGSADSGSGASDSGTDPDASSTTATTRKSGPPATTGPGSGSGTGSSTNCGQPDTAQSPAPQVGEDPQTHEASEAGSVEVERLSQTELRIAKATANDGWTHQVTAPSGPRVNVRFTRSGQSPSLIRFAASMDQAGQEIHVRVTTCG